MEMWNSIDSLKSLSHSLMWATAIFAVLAAVATGIRYYVDSRVSELSSQAQRTDTEIKERSQREREVALKLQVEAAQREQQEARNKLSTLEQNVKGRHLSSSQSTALTAMAKKACRVLPVVNVTAANSNHEAQVYGTEFVKALKAAGCASDLALPIPGLTPDVMGIHIGVRDPKNVSPGATELSKILSTIGVQFGISPIKPDFFPEAQFVLVIAPVATSNSPTRGRVKLPHPGDRTVGIFNVISVYAQVSPQLPSIDSSCLRIPARGCDA